MENFEYSEIIRQVVEPLLSVKEALFIKRLDKEEDLEKKIQNYLVCVDTTDLVKLVAGHGTNANAIRDLVNSFARNDKKKVFITFESLSEGNSENQD